MNIFESIVQALQAIVANKMRAFLTLVSICIGVFAIMLSGTLVDSLNESIAGEIESSGENTFSVTRMPSFTNDRRKYNSRKPIYYSQYKKLRQKMTLTDQITAMGHRRNITVQSGHYETKPDVQMIGADENYFSMNDILISEGRPFTYEDIEAGRNVALIGNDVKAKIFPNSSPIGRKIQIKNQSYKVIGLLEERGALFFHSMDNQVVVPISYYLQYVDNWWRASLNIDVKAESKELLTETMDETIGIMRTIRRVQPWEKNDFEVDTKESIANQFKSFTKYLTIFGLVVSISALFAAGVGIMNIMLITVKERTREIGVRKAVGAKSSWVLYQFIIETITICQLGGAIGIALGLGASAALSNVLEISLYITPYWIAMSVGMCTLLGLLFGFYPAWKAARLNPIDALRYE